MSKTTKNQIFAKTVNFVNFLLVLNEISKTLIDIRLVAMVVVCSTEFY